LYGNPIGMARTISLRRVNANRKKERDNAMLWTIFVILLVLWLVGLVSFHAIGAYIHILLVLALVVLLIQLISGRRAAL
jgi:fatty acid desaturase